MFTYSKVWQTWIMNLSLDIHIGSGDGYVLNAGKDLEVGMNLTQSISENKIHTLVIKGLFKHM